MLSQELIDSLFPADLPAPGALGAPVPAADAARAAPRSPGSRRARPAGCTSAASSRASVDHDIATAHRRRLPACASRTPTRRGSSEGALAQFEAGFELLRHRADEGGRDRRATVPTPSRPAPRSTMTYVRELMRQGKAYPCFETTEQARGARRAAEGDRRAPRLLRRVGDLAGRRRTDQVRDRLAAGDPYVVRFRSPGDRRPAGQLHRRDPRRDQPDDNRNDVVILKSSDRPLRLPTYHFAHAVDDHLMRVTLVIRGEEWLSSVPAAPPAVRRARLPPDPVRARRAADEAGRRQPPQAVQAQGP